jgi:hypothetical protein
VTLCNVIDMYQCLEKLSACVFSDIAWLCLRKAFLCQIEVLMLVILKNTVFFNVTPGNLVSDILFLT